MLEGGGGVEGVLEGGGRGARGEVEGVLEGGWKGC